MKKLKTVQYGFFKNGIPDGVTTSISFDGGKVIGNVKNGLFDGPVTTTKDAKTFTQTYKNGILQRPSTPFTLILGTKKLDLKDIFMTCYHSESLNIEVEQNIYNQLKPCKTEA
jgi:hypothetical protein